ncbi:MAG TPA: hypothetical protein VKK61_06850 [Tepidisphaeraceae bacterium]|nr:hypothetical protein [Tepidisphaeraceae bacterium]
MQFRNFHRALIIFAIIGVSDLSAWAVNTPVVVPNGSASTEGNDDNAFPFDIGAGSLSSERYQQAYNASSFAAITTPELITQLIFRPDSLAGGAFDSTISNIQIDLSTTTKSANSLDATFANNVGLDDTVVFNGSLHLSSTFTGPVNGPKDFDIVINLTTPFLYDPGVGNLLLDVRNFSGGTTTSFDAADLTEVGRVYTTSVPAGDVTSSSGTVENNNGLVTKFTFSSIVPEPGVSVLVLAGLLGGRRRAR